MNTLQLQVHAVIVFGLAGAAAALLFDALRTLRWVLGARPISTAIADLMYWVAVAALLIVALMAGNWGDIRFHVPFAVSTGAGLYFYLAGPAVRALMRALVAACAWLIGTTLGLVTLLIVQPSQWICAWTWRIFAWCWGMVLRPLVILLTPVRRAVRSARVSLTDWWSGISARFHPPDPPDDNANATPEQEPEGAPREK